MLRAVKVSLKFATAKKIHRLDHLLRRMRKCTNQYIRHIWVHGGSLDKATKDAVLYPSLTSRQRCCCHKYALDIVHSTKESAKALGKVASRPLLKNGMKLSCLVATIEKGKGSFDYVLRISGTVPRKIINLPFKSHKVLEKWLAVPSAKLLDGCVINKDCTMATIWVELPDLPDKQVGDILGIDIGYNKLIADSDGNFYGKEIKQVCEKVRRKKPGSRAKQRARRERDQYIDWCVKQLPWGKIRLLGMEDLTGLKKGKSKNRSKVFRKRLAPWTHCQVAARATEKAQEYRVHLELVDPRNTSRTCPECGTVSKRNRQGEKFRCIVCYYTADADYVGSRNVIVRTCENCQESIVPGPLMREVRSNKILRIS